MDTGGKTAGIGYVLCLLDVLLVDFRQTIDVVVAALDAEVLCQVDYFNVLGDGVFFEESLALAVTESEEDDVNLVEGHRVGKLQIGIANESLVDI